MLKGLLGKRPYRFLFTLLFLFLLSACTNTVRDTPIIMPTVTPDTNAEAEQQLVDNTLNILYWQAPQTLNPHLSTGVKDWAAGRIPYEPLASFDNDGELVLFLATEKPTVENGGLDADLRAVTWKLKQGISWSDGEPFTADDVLFTYEFITDPATNAASKDNYSAIERVEVVDDYTVTLHFDDVNPAWFLPFVGAQGVILPRHIFAPYSGANARSAPANWGATVGTGPYQVVQARTEEVLLLGDELVETTRIIYEPNPSFREADQPYFSRVILHGGGTTTEAARLVLQTGDVDFAWNLQLDKETLDSFQETADTGHIVPILGPKVERILLNRTDPNQATASGERASLQFPHPFFSDEEEANQKVRQAFALAIDRDAIVELYPGSEATSNVLVAPAYYASPNTSYTFDLQKAAELLDEAGWIDTDGDGIRDKNGIPMRVLYRTSVNPVRQATQRLVQADMLSVGIDVEIEAVDASNFFNRDPDNENNTFHFYADLQEFFDGNDSPDPSVYMVRWTCDQIPQKENGWSGFNRERWCNPTYDALYQQAVREVDAQERQQLFIQMNDMIVENVVSIPLVHRAQLAGVSNTLAGVELTPWDADVWNIQEWRRTP